MVWQILTLRTKSDVTQAARWFADKMWRHKQPSALAPKLQLHTCRDRWVVAVMEWHLCTLLLIDLRQILFIEDMGDFLHNSMKSSKVFIFGQLFDSFKGNIIYTRSLQCKHWNMHFIDTLGHICPWCWYQKGLILFPQHGQVPFQVLSLLYKIKIKVILFKFRDAFTDPLISLPTR